MELKWSKSKIKCVKCHNEAEYIYGGYSLCAEHAEVYSEKWNKEQERIENKLKKTYERNEKTLKRLKKRSKARKQKTTSLFVDVKDIWGRIKNKLKRKGNE